MKKFALAAIVALLAGPITSKSARPQSSQPQLQPGTIHGKVVREGTSEPIPDVQIFLNAPSAAPTEVFVTLSATLMNAVSGVVLQNGQAITVNGAPPQTPTGPTAITDSAGAFLIRDVPAGKHVLSASRDGYFGPSRATIQSSVQETTTVTSGKTAEVTFVMIPGGTIAGRILTPTGDLAADVPVQALRMTYQEGTSILQPISTRSTDDRGDYRLFRLAPGQYYVVAGQAAGGPGGGGVRGTAPPPPPPPPGISQNTVRTFYPDVTDAGSAIAINVRGGDELGGINIRIQPASSTRKISGQVMTTIPVSEAVSPIRAPAAAPGANPIRGGGPAAPAGGAPPLVAIAPAQGAYPNATLTLIPRSKNGPQDPAPGLSTSVVMADPDNGRFELRNVPRGTYEAFASMLDVTGYGPANPPGVASGPLGYGRTTVEVGDRDPEGVRLTIHHGVDLNAKITIDGNTSPAAANVRVSLQADESALKIPVYQQVGRYQPVVDAEGSFTIPAVPEAQYRFQVTFGPPSNNAQTSTVSQAPPLGPNAYVADIRQGGSSVYDTGISVGDRPLGPIEVVVRTNGGGLDGIVAGANKLPAGAATVVLIPVPSRRDNPSLYKTATSDAMGRFSVRGIAPGEYTIFAWTDVPGAAYRNPEFMKKYEGRGASVMVMAGAKLSVSVDLISEDASR